MAHETGRKVGTLRMVMGDAHLYEEHAGVAAKQVKRVPYQFPTIEINRVKDGLWNVHDDDIKIYNYKHHGKLKAKMAV